MANNDWRDDEVRTLRKWWPVRPTCRNVIGCHDVFECSERRCRAELVTEVCNEYGDPFHVPLMPSFCPNRGAVVTEKE